MYLPRIRVAGDDNHGSGIRARAVLLIRIRATLRPYSRTMPRAPWWVLEGGRFPMSEEPLYWIWMGRLKDASEKVVTSHPSTPQRCHPTDPELNTPPETLNPEP